MENVGRSEASVTGLSLTDQEGKIWETASGGDIVYYVLVEVVCPACGSGSREPIY